MKFEKVFRNLDKKIKKQDLFKYEIKLRFDKYKGGYKSTFGGFVSIIINILMSW